MTVKELHTSQEKLRTLAEHAQYSGSADMTAEVADMVLAVKELHTFTDEEIETITDALRIMNSYYRMMAETAPMRAPWAPADIRAVFEDQARDAADLRLKIEASL